MNWINKFHILRFNSITGASSAWREQVYRLVIWTCKNLFEAPTFHPKFVITSLCSHILIATYFFANSREVPSLTFVSSLIPGAWRRSGARQDKRSLVFQISAKSVVELKFLLLLSSTHLRVNQDYDDDWVKFCSAIKTVVTSLEHRVSFGGSRKNPVHTLWRKLLVPS